jgi:hypothetical protein
VPIDDDEVPRPEVSNRPEHQPRHGVPDQRRRRQCDRRRDQNAEQAQQLSALGFPDRQLEDDHDQEHPTQRGDQQLLRDSA